MPESYEQAAARCKLSIEAFETASESSFGSDSNSSFRPRGVGAAVIGKEKRQQQLIERYSVLTNSMMDWGVEVSKKARASI